MIEGVLATDVYPIDSSARTLKQKYRNEKQQCRRLDGLVPQSEKFYFPFHDPVAPHAQLLSPTVFCAVSYTHLTLPTIYSV